MRLASLVLILSACGGGGAGTPDAATDPGATCATPPAPASGEGTYYAATGAGACSFDPSPGDLLVAALNAPDWHTAAWCGACVDVTGPSGHVVVRIVDECPECKPGDLDLSPEAFGHLAPLATGRIPITWHLVPCDVTGPIAYRFKEGSNPYWTAIQVRDHRYPIAALEARDGAGAWHPLVRQDYNFFVADAGLGAGPYALRVTDRFGHVVEDAAVPFAPATTAPGAAQLPACP